MKGSRRIFLNPSLPIIVAIILSSNTAISKGNKIKYACNPRNTASRAYAFCNTSFPIKPRVEDLISRLNLKEKVGQLSNGASEIPRLGIPGLTCWAANITVFRDPRRGRGQDTPGEDPLLCSKYAVAHVRGFQREDARLKTGRLMLSACCKHFTAYDLEKWEGFCRYTFNAWVSQQDLKDIYQPPFKSCVEDSDVSCMMCSYNQVNGVPACVRYDLLSQTVRLDWRFEGGGATVASYLFHR